jgi:hypothetical protein
MFMYNNYFTNMLMLYMNSINYLLEFMYNIKLLKNQYKFYYKINY